MVYSTVTLLIISMTKLLDADWLRGVQLFQRFSQNKQNGGKVFCIEHKCEMKLPLRN